MAGTTVELLMGRLIKLEELIERIDPKRMLQELEQPLQRASEELIHELDERYFSNLWRVLPKFARQALIGRVKRQIPDDA
jgi:hypothetical protein